MKLWVTTMATTMTVVALCFFNLLVNQNYMFLLSNGIYLTTYPERIDGRITAQTAFYPINFNANSTVVNNSTLSCCSGYVMWNETCYWPGVDYEEASKKWNNSTVEYITNGICPSFSLQVNVPNSDVFIVFWPLTIILICIVVTIGGTFKVFAIIRTSLRLEVYCICGYFWIVSMVCYLAIYVMIGIAPVDIPIEYVEISQGNPWPINILTYVLTCVLAIFQAMIISRNYDKIRQHVKANSNFTEIEMGVIV